MADSGSDSAVLVSLSGAPVSASPVESFVTLWDLPQLDINKLARIERLELFWEVEPPSASHVAKPAPVTTMQGAAIIDLFETGTERAGMGDPETTSIPGYVNVMRRRLCTPHTNQHTTHTPQVESRGCLFCGE